MASPPGNNNSAPLQPIGTGVRGGGRQVQAFNPGFNPGFNPRFGGRGGHGRRQFAPRLWGHSRRGGPFGGYGGGYGNYNNNAHYGGYSTFGQGGHNQGRHGWGGWTDP